MHFDVVFVCDLRVWDWSGVDDAYKVFWLCFIRVKESQQSNVGHRSWTPHFFCLESPPAL